MGNGERYKRLLDEVRAYGGNEIDKILSIPLCEYDDTFLGFLCVYDDARMIADKHYTIVDLGCYMAAQAVLFRDYHKYIGVDVNQLPRVHQDNTEHYVMTIQEYLEGLSDTSNMFAICSYVPGDEIHRMVMEKFDNYLVVYGSERYSNIKNF